MVLIFFLLAWVFLGGEVLVWESVVWSCDFGV
jgi:hypothetical protein